MADGREVQGGGGEEFGDEGGGGSRRRINRGGLTFQERPEIRFGAAAKTQWEVSVRKFGIKGGACLGHIIYYDEWNKWVFKPFSQTHYSSATLHVIYQTLEKIELEWAAGLVIKE